MIRHPAFAAVELKLADLATEAEMLRAAEEEVHVELSKRDAVSQWVASSSRGSGIESLYTGMENTLRNLFSALGEEVVTTGEGFHSQLLAQAAIANEGREAIISRSLWRALDELKRFRHLERNIYASSFDPNRVATLTIFVLETRKTFEAEIRAFMASATLA
jgi:hypothetical protein